MSMLIFEVDGTRAVPVGSVEPSQDRFDGDVRAVLAEHLSALLGDRVFTVARRSPDRPELPYAAVLDAGGQVRVIDVVHTLDAERLASALARAERVLCWSWGELQAAYGPGPERFDADWSAFRDLAAPTTRPDMPRLLIICAEAIGEAEAAARFLTRQMTGVQVVQAGVLHNRGRRQIALDRAGSFPSIIAATDPGAGPTMAGGTEPTMTHDTNQTRASSTNQRHEATSGAAAAEAMSQAWQAENDIPTPPAGIGTGGRALARRPAGAEDQTFESPAPREVASDARALAALSAAIGGETPLVWNRQRRGLRYDAMLSPPGVIRLPDGRTCSDPHVAAALASGSEGADGWRVWRLGETGPTLAQAVRSMRGRSL